MSHQLQNTPLLDAPSPAAQKLELLRELFPQAVEATPEGRIRINPEAIQLALDPAGASVQVKDGDGYELRWVGKREAYHSAFLPSRKIVQPLLEKSEGWDTTGNLLIKGDNLDALRLLRQSYFEAVKLIYIDPPYNTQSDAFVYRDDFTASQAEVLAQLGYSSENIDYVKNIYGARTHSGWLSFMYPRLLLARDLLRDDGVIFISIDDNEQAQLKLLCDEVFGQENFISCLVWEKGRKNDAKLFSNGHEYMLAYAKSLTSIKEKNTLWREEKPGARDIWQKYVELRSLHGPDDKAIEMDLSQWFSDLPRGHAAKKWMRYKRVDKYGPWRDRDISWPGGDGPRYDVRHPVTHLPCKIPERGWIYADPMEMQRQIDLGLVEFRADHTEPPFRKAHIRPVAAELLDAHGEDSETEDEELASQVRGTYFYKQSQVSVRHLRNLLGDKVFNNPKDLDEIARLIDYATSSDKDCLILDFFAGSGTTGEAAMQLNAADGGQRRFVLVQIPQLIDEKKQKNAHEFIVKTLGSTEATVFEITAERLRRAGRRIAQEKSGVDTGFRVFELVEDADALVLNKPLNEATQDDVQALQASIATPQPEQLDRVLYNLLLAENLPLSTYVHVVEPECLYLARDVALIVKEMKLTELADKLQALQNQARPLQYLTVYAPWVQDDNFILGIRTLVESLGLSADKLHLRG